MNRTLRRWVLGRTPTPFRVARWLALAGALFAVTFAGYAVDVFTIPGGIVWVPGDAALLGLLGAGLVAADRGGFPAAWLVADASLLGYHADHAFLGLSPRPFPQRIAYFLDGEGLLVFGLMAIVVAAIAYVPGTLLRWGVETHRSGENEPESPRTGR